MNAQLAHYADKLAYEIDSWDLSVALRNGANVVVIDARAPDAYAREHIPGAINLPHLDNLDGDGNHRSMHELAARFAGVGTAPVVYCGSGVTACHDLLAMSIAGVTDARLYPGSWSDWSSQPDRPIATGE